MTVLPSMPFDLKQMMEACPKLQHFHYMLGMMHRHWHACFVE